uniref:Uncharacterized protein n=1 Tax=Glossina palpalis gambiensis TaxID=67801 RepID=A0A1B0B5Q4_9MUSC
MLSFPCQETFPTFWGKAEEEDVHINKQMVLTEIALLLSSVVSKTFFQTLRICRLKERGRLLVNVDRAMREFCKACELNNARISRWINTFSNQEDQLPDKRPQLFTEHTRYEPGDVLRANCSTPPSRPRAELKFTINNMVMHILSERIFSNYVRLFIPVMGNWELGTHIHVDNCKILRYCRPSYFTLSYLPLPAIYSYSILTTDELWSGERISE